MFSPGMPVSPIALAACGLVMLGVVALLASLLRRRERPASVSVGEDLLAEAEDRTITARFVGREAPQARAAADEAAGQSEALEIEVEPPPADMDWQEQEDVYRPETVNAADFVRALALERPPELVPNQIYIFIRQSAYAALREHLRRDLSVELGGLLYGQANYDPQASIYLLTIEAALAASEGIETAVSFAYTSASWQALTPQLQQLDPAWTLIGSYHSHPGLGVFLSKTDLYTQETIFAQDWQIALVVDPIADIVGFFVGKAGTPCLHWLILPDRVTA
jgi:proteasome lid subunit RPN8/RPN11